MVRQIRRYLSRQINQPCKTHLGPQCGNKTRKTRSGVQDGLEVEKVVVMVVYLVFLMDLTIRQ